MGRAEARPAPCILFIAGLQGTTSPARASREQAPLRSPKPQDSRIPATRPPADLWDSRYQAPDASDHAPGMHPARPGPQAGPVLSLASQGACAARRDDSAVAHPGGRLSDWLAGPSSGHACWRTQVRHRARQALIRASLGLQESVLT